MKKIIGWFREIFGDSDGSQSSKRFIAIFAFGLCAVAFLTNLVYDLSVHEYMWDGMITLVVFGLGFVAAEKFTGILQGRSSSKPAKPSPPAPKKKDDEEEEGMNV